MFLPNALDLMTACFNEPKKERKFRNVSMGMTQEEVKAVEKFEFIADEIEDGKHRQVYFGQSFGLYSTLVYCFNDNKLVTGVTSHIIKQEECLGEHYYKIMAALIKKYGEISQTVENWKNPYYKQVFFKNDPKIATKVFLNEHAQIVHCWHHDGVVIILAYTKSAEGDHFIHVKYLDDRIVKESRINA